MRPNDFVLHLLKGESSEPEQVLYSAYARIPFTVGTKGTWRVEARDVAPVHVVIMHDGASLLVRAEPGQAAELNGQALTAEWVRISTFARLVFGGARVSLAPRQAPSESAANDGTTMVVDSTDKLLSALASERAKDSRLAEATTEAPLPARAGSEPPRPSPSAHAAPTEVRSPNDAREPKFDPYRTMVIPALEAPVEEPRRVHVVQASATTAPPIAVPSPSPVPLAATQAPAVVVQPAPVVRRAPVNMPPLPQPSPPPVSPTQAPVAMAEPLPEIRRAPAGMPPLPSPSASPAPGPFRGPSTAPMPARPYTPVDPSAPRSVAPRTMASPSAEPPAPARGHLPSPAAPFLPAGAPAPSAMAPMPSMPPSRIVPSVDLPPLGVAAQAVASPHDAGAPSRIVVPPSVQWISARPLAGAAGGAGHLPSGATRLAHELSSGPATVAAPELGAYAPQVGSLPAPVAAASSVRPPQLERVARAWKEASPVRKASIALAFPAVLAVLLLVAKPNAEASALSTSAHPAVATQGTTAAAPASSPAASPVQASAPSAPEVRSAPLPPSPALAASAPVAPVTASHEPPAPAPVVEAKVSRRSPDGRKAGPKKTADRVALDKAAEGSYATAAELYASLAADHPDNPSYAEAARILSAKAKAPSGS